MARLDQAVLSGIYRDGHAILNPPSDRVIHDGDRLIVFSEAKHSAILLEQTNMVTHDRDQVPLKVAPQHTGVLIVGYNDTLPIILRELPENVAYAYLPAELRETEYLTQCQAVADRRGLQLQYRS